MEIITNNKARPVIYGFELSNKEKEQFDYLDGVDSASFFRYKGNLYDIGEAVYITSMGDWQGIYSQSYFHGVLIKISMDMESVIVGRYYS